MTIPTSKQERQLFKMTKIELESMFKISAIGLTKKEMIYKILKDLKNDSRTSTHSRA